MSEPDFGPDEVLEGLRRDAATLGLNLPEMALERLVRYLALLRKWNAAYNLTAVRDAAQMRVQHLADCMAVIAPLHHELGGRAHKNAILLQAGWHLNIL